MATIRPFLRDQSVFDPKDIAAMSAALDDISLKLELGDDVLARATIATRIVDLATAGERDASRLRDRVLQEADAAERAVLGTP